MELSCTIEYLNDNYRCLTIYGSLDRNIIITPIRSREIPIKKETLTIKLVGVKQLG